MRELSEKIGVFLFYHFVLYALILVLLSLLTYLSFTDVCVAFTVKRENTNERMTNKEIVNVCFSFLL